MRKAVRAAMTKPVTRRMAVDCLLDRAAKTGHPIHCGESKCLAPLLPGQAIQFDHVHSDVMGGPHEYQNLRPLHRDCHKPKTKRDVQAHRKVKRIRGETKQQPKRKWPARKLRSGSRFQRKPR